jgi:hypothetical protein
MDEATDGELRNLINSATGHLGGPSVAVPGLAPSISCAAHPLRSTPPWGKLANEVSNWACTP